ncbi:MAG: hypothetical protein ABSD57_09295 [Verrucomicrobiota bacterium]|jgi:hypothetical protein
MKSNSLANLLIFALTIFVSGGNYASKAAESTNQFPTDEMAYNEANPKMIWGAATNFVTGDISGKAIYTALRAGINISNGMVVLSGNPPELLSKMEIGFENISTNFIQAARPKLNEWLTLSMTNTNGVPLPKTAEGMALGQQSSLKTNTFWPHWRRYGTSAPLFDHSVDMFTFDPTKYFKIEESGLYKLTVVQRLYVINTNTYLKTITLPPVTVDVRVEKDAKR